MFEIPEWPNSLGEPVASGFIRTKPEDFVVEEIPRVLPEGEGSHLWLWIEKRSTNTDWVARELARVYDCPPRDVGFAGLKDRHAITRQWFSVPVKETTQSNLESTDIDGVKVLQSLKHSRKLKRGTLNGNRFSLKIREFKGDADQTDLRLQQIRSNGVPNYFGPQRFGHGGQNVEKGFSLLRRGVRLQRNKKSIYLSAIRSFLFNQVLAERVRQGVWNSIIPGELVMLDGTQSIFPCEITDSDIEERCKRLDIHPTGPLPGKDGTQPTEKALEFEQNLLQNWLELSEVLISQGVKASRRALRLCPAELEWGFDEGTMTLSFVLPPGAYATTVLGEILMYSVAEQSLDQ